MKKEFTLRYRIKAALTILKGVDSLIEACENCGSVHVATSYQNPVVELKDGSHSYVAKYMCKKCGCTAHVNEIWDVKNR